MKTTENKCEKYFFPLLFAMMGVLVGSIGLTAALTFYIDQNRKF